jgi:hypothetical protein
VVLQALRGFTSEARWLRYANSHLRWDVSLSANAIRLQQACLGISGTRGRLRRLYLNYRDVRAALGAVGADDDQAMKPSSLAAASEAVVSPMTSKPPDRCWTNCLTLRYPMPTI